MVLQSPLASGSLASFWSSPSSDAVIDTSSGFTPKVLWSSMWALPAFPYFITGSRPRQETDCLLDPRKLKRTGDLYAMSAILQQ